MVSLFQETVTLGFCFGKNGNYAAVAVAALEVYDSVGQGEERVILAHAHILSGIVDRTALADDDVTGNAGLTAPNLNA